MRFSIVPALLLLLASGCARQAEELLPIPASVKGASRVAEVEVTYARRAIQAIGANDKKVEERAGEGAGERFSELLARAVREEAEKAGLTSGRALKLIVELDALQTVSTGGALIGRDDRLDGSVFVRDAATGESLGQLYVEIDRNNGGFISALARIGNVRESLARQFGGEVARALGGKTR